MIVFESVSKTFFPDQSGLKNVSFSVEPGELIVLTGHSGSGKTTLMRLLTKEYVPTSGKVTFDGTDISSIKKNKLHEHRRKIGVVFQDYRLIPEMNVWENIALPLGIVGKSQAVMEERVTDLLKLVQLTEKAHLFPAQLSGGEAQRISIARALAIGPSVIFADEPTGNLDMDTTIAIAELLHKINELGTTLIFATHDPKILSMYSDERHIQLKDGQIEFDSKQKEVKKAESESKPHKKVKQPTHQPSEKKQPDQELDKKDSDKPELPKPEETKPKEKKPGILGKLFGKKTPPPPTQKTVTTEEELDAPEKKADREEPKAKETKQKEKK